MFSPNNSLFGGLAAVILTLVIIGAVSGLALSNSDLANPITNAVEAEGIKNQNDFQAGKSAIDLEDYKEVQDTKTQITIDKLWFELEQGLRFQAQKDAQDLEVARLASHFMMGAGVFMAFCFGIGIVVYLTQAGRNRLLLAQSQVRQADPWQDLLWRKQQVKSSRKRERTMREKLTSSTSNVKVPAFYPEDELILWEDFRQQYVEARRP
jgi:hypothetical protein